MRDSILKRSKTSKTLVIYHYYEKDQSYIDNFSHFIRFGYESTLDYLIIVAGEYTIDFLALPNIEYLFVENKNFDYGGYSTAILSMTIWQQYDFYIFINSSVRGPFLTRHFSKKWPDLFTDQLIGDAGIVGSSISITPSSHSICMLYHEKYGHQSRNKKFLGHVQTTCYAIRRDMLEKLKSLGFYGQTESLTKDETVRDYEIHLSQLILNMNCNLQCLLPEYNQIDYRKDYEDINPASREGDSGFEGSYFGRTIHPYESIFIKTSRNTYSDSYLLRLAYSMSAAHPIDKNLEKSSFVNSFIEKAETAALMSTGNKKISWKKRFRLF